MERKVYSVLVIGFCVVDGMFKVLLLIDWQTRQKDVELSQIDEESLNFGESVNVNVSVSVKGNISPKRKRIILMF